MSDHKKAAEDLKRWMDEPEIEPKMSQMYTTTTEFSYAPALIQAYVELNKLSAAPGDKCHMLADSIKFIERMIREELK